MFHDPEVYDRPEDFWPERFIISKYGTKKDKQEDVGRKNTLHFGCGRRMCAGMTFANYSMGVVTANLLWAFKFAPIKNAAGQELKPDIWNYPQALSTHPNRFESDISLRRPEFAKIIKGQFSENAPMFEAFESNISPADAEYVAKQRAYAAM